MKLRKNRKKGFTLIELIVVIAILGILAAILIPQFGNFRKTAQANAVKAEAKSVATAIDSYFALNGTYPAKADFASDGAMVTGKFITADIAKNVTAAAGGTDAGFTYTKVVSATLTVVAARVGTGEVKITSPADYADPAETTASSAG